MKRFSTLLCLLFSVHLAWAQLDVAKYDALIKLVGIPSASAELKLNYNANDLEGKARDVTPYASVDALRAKMQQKPNDPEAIEKLALQLRAEFPRSPEIAELLERSKKIRWQQFDQSKNEDSFYKLVDHYALIWFQPDSAINLLAYVHDNEVIPNIDKSAKFFQKVSYTALLAQRYELAYNTALKAFELDPTDTENVVQRSMVEYFRMMFGISQKTEAELANLDPFSLSDTSYMEVVRAKHPSPIVSQNLSHTNFVVYTMMKSIFTMIHTMSDTVDMKDILAKGGIKISLTAAQQKRLKEAELWYQKQLKAKKVHPSYAHQVLMIISWLNNDLPGCRKAFDLVVKQDPENMQAYQNMAFVFMLNNEWENSIKIIQMVPRVEKSPLGQQLLASKYYHLEKYAEAAAAAGRLEALNPLDDKLWLLIIWKQLYDKRLDAAKANLERLRDNAEIRKSKDFFLYDVALDLAMGKLTDARYKAKLALIEHEDFPTMKKVQDQFLQE
jgi:hypothetical protein